METRRKERVEDTNIQKLSHPTALAQKPHSGRHVAIIGAGSAGIHTAHALAVEGCSVTLFNRDLRPGGLAEYGRCRYRDAPPAKMHRRLAAYLSHPRIQYVGGVYLHPNGNLPPDALMTLGYDALVVATGAPHYNDPGIENTFALDGVHSAKAVAFHRNHRYPWSQENILLGSSLIIVGAGAAAIDVAQWGIEMQVPEITILVRRGPFQMSAVTTELKCLGAYIDRQALRAETERIGLQLENIGVSAQTAYQSLVERLVPPTIPDRVTTVRFRFATQPIAAIRVQQQLIGLRVMDCSLDREDNTVHSIPLIESGMLPCDTLVIATGDSLDTEFGLNDTAGRLNPPQSEAIHHAYDVRSDRFVVGNAHTPRQRSAACLEQDAAGVARIIVDSFRGQRRSNTAPPSAADWLNVHGIRTMDWPTVQRVQRREQTLRQRLNDPGFKFSTPQQMWDAADDLEKTAR